MEDGAEPGPLVAQPRPDRTETSSTLPPPINVNTHDPATVQFQPAMTDHATDPYRELEIDGVPPDFAKIVRLSADSQTAVAWLRTGKGGTPEGRAHWTACGTDERGRWVEFRGTETKRYHHPEDTARLEEDASPAHPEMTPIDDSPVHVWKKREMKARWLSAPGTVDRYCIVYERLRDSDFAMIAEQSVVTMTRGGPGEKHDPDETPMRDIGFFRLKGRGPEGSACACTTEELATLGHDPIWLPEPMIDVLFPKNTGEDA